MAGRAWTPEEIAAALDPAINTPEAWRTRLPGNTRTHDGISQKRYTLQREAGVALPFFTQGVNRRALRMSHASRSQSGAPQIVLPESDRPIYTSGLSWEMVAGETIVILPDVHIPYQDAPFMQQVVGVGLAWGADRAVLAGDYMDMASWSHFVTMESELTESFEGEVEAANQLTNALSQLYPRQLAWLLGNHEFRAVRETAGRFGMWALQRLLDHPERLQVTDWDHMLVIGQVDAPIRIVHPDRTRKNPTSWAREVATIYEQNVILAHSHQVGFCRTASGHFWAIDSGMCADGARLSYVHIKTKPMTRPQQGAVLLRCAEDGRIIPYAVYPESDFEALKRLYG